MAYKMKISGPKIGDPQIFKYEEQVNSSGYISTRYLSIGGMSIMVKEV